MGTLNCKPKTPKPLAAPAAQSSRKLFHVDSSSGVRRIDLVIEPGELAVLPPGSEFVTLPRPCGNCRNCGAAPTGAVRCEYCGTLW
jgi:hypothetical protein